MRWNKALWLAVPSPMAIFYQASKVLYFSVATVLLNLFMTSALVSIRLVQKASGHYGKTMNGGARL